MHGCVLQMRAKPTAAAIVRYSSKTNFTSTPSNNTPAVDCCSTQQQNAISHKYSRHTEWQACKNIDSSMPFKTSVDRATIKPEMRNLLTDCAQACHLSEPHRHARLRLLPYSHARRPHWAGLRSINLEKGATPCIWANEGLLRPETCLIWRRRPMLGGAQGHSLAS